MLSEDLRGISKSGCRVVDGEANGELLLILSAGVLGDDWSQELRPYPDTQEGRASRDRDRLLFTAMARFTNAGGTLAGIRMCVGDYASIDPPVSVPEGAQLCSVIQSGSVEQLYERSDGTLVRIVEDVCEEELTKADYIKAAQRSEDAWLSQL